MGILLLIPVIYPSWSERKTTGAFKQTKSHLIYVYLRLMRNVISFSGLSWYNMHRIESVIPMQLLLWRSFKLRWEGVAPRRPYHPNANFLYWNRSRFFVINVFLGPKRDRSRTDMSHQFRPFEPKSPPSEEDSAYPWEVTENEKPFEKCYGVFNLDFARESRFVFYKIT